VAPQGTVSGSCPFPSAYQINQQINLPGARTPTSGATLSFISLLAEIYEPRARELEKKHRSKPKDEDCSVGSQQIVFVFPCVFFLFFFCPAWGKKKDSSPLAFADQSAFIIYNSRRLAFFAWQPFLIDGTNPRAQARSLSQSQQEIPIPGQSTTHQSTLCHIQLLYRFVPSPVSSAGIAISKHFIVTHLAQMGHRRLPRPLSPGKPIPNLPFPIQVAIPGS